MGTIKITEGNELQIGKIYKASFTFNKDNYPFLVLEKDKETSFLQSYEVLTKNGIETFSVFKTTWFDEVIC